ncbi:MAG: hypothetical protein M3N52_05395, partial [Actinomycetota bacterium]|nr:hypothetical protein [Actinomycetota bacterium]
PGAGFPFPGRREGGGVTGYQLNDLWKELTYLAYHLHWPLDSLLDLEHSDRVRLLREVAQLNERARAGA